MVSEVALASLVLIAAGLLMRSFVRLRAVDPGFQPSNLLTLRLPLSPNAPIERRVALLNRLSGRIAVLPGVRSVGAVNNLPLTGLGVGTTFAVDGRPAPPPEQRPMGLVRAVTPDYFRTMAIPLVSGRFFTESDTAQSPFRIIVNQSLARLFQCGKLGRQLRLRDLERGALLLQRVNPLFRFPALGLEILNLALPGHEPLFEHGARGAKVEPCAQRSGDRSSA